MMTLKVSPGKCIQLKIKRVEGLGDDSTSEDMQEFGLLPSPISLSQREAPQLPKDFSKVKLYFAISQFRFVELKSIKLVNQRKY